ncbi:MAG: cell wall-binding repeat-containing protein [Actinobacteria bacterium]|nr:cell wall-binding repeat-containing protein [Actinomycetota bacterium]
MRLRRLIAAAAVTASVTVAVPSTAANPATPAGGYVYGGMYTGDFWNHADQLNRAGAWAGRKLTFSGMFHDLTEDPGATAHLFEQGWAAQATPFANVKAEASAARIASGEFDGAINRWRDSVKRWLDQGGGRSAIIAPLQEMNGSWTPWGCDPASFKAAYRRIVGAFRATGINETKVRWAYAPNGWSDPKCGDHNLASYYPGDDVVDLIAISGYNYGPKGYHGWESPAQVFGPYLDELRTFAAHKPFMIAQTGVAPQGGDRDQWLRDAYAFLAADPNVVGIVYFNIDKTAWGGNEWDWRIWYGDRGIAGFRDAMTSTRTAYAWPLRSWFRPGPLRFGPIERVYGTNRILTAIALSGRTYGTAPAVVVAPEHVYGPALLGGPLAAKLGGPVLLTSPHGLNDETLAEIRRLGAGTAYVVGSTADISAAVDQRLTAAGVATHRVGGGNVFDVARNVAHLVGGHDAYVVEGDNPDPRRGWPDAIAVSGLAAAQRRPILFVEADRLPDETRLAIRELRLQRATIVGGTAAVSDAVAQAIAAENVGVARVKGTTRYETSRAVADVSTQAGLRAARTYLATGEKFPDALAAGPVVAADGGVLLLVSGANMEGSTQTRDWLRAHPFERVRLVGGRAVITEHVEGETLGVVSD